MPSEGELLSRNAEIIENVNGCFLCEASNSQDTSDSPGTSESPRTNYEDMGDALQDTLRSLCGSWIDKKGSTYSLRLNAKGSIDVTTWRPSEVSSCPLKRNHIRIEPAGPDEEHQVVFGTEGKPYSLRDYSLYSGLTLTWHRNGSRPYFWRRLGLSEILKLYPLRGSQDMHHEQKGFLEANATLRRLCGGSWVDVAGSSYSLTLNARGFLDLTMWRPSDPGNLHRKIDFIRIEPHGPAEEREVVFGKSRLHSMEDLLRFFLNLAPECLEAMLLEAD